MVTLASSSTTQLPFYDADGHLSFTSSPTRTVGDDSESSCFDLSTFTKEIEDWMRTMDDSNHNNNEPSTNDAVPNNDGIVGGRRSAVAVEFAPTLPPQLRPREDPPPSDIRCSSFSVNDEKVSTMSSVYPAEPDPVQSPPFTALSGLSIPSIGETPPRKASDRGQRQYESNPPRSPKTKDDVSVWENLIESMKQTMRLQNEQIRTLRKENSDLRRQLALQQATSEESSHAERETECCKCSKNKGSREAVSSDDDVRFELHQDSFPTPSQQQHPFSPGTKFVAELSQYMDLEVGHFAALSHIMDKRLSSKKSNSVHRDDPRY